MKAAMVVTWTSAYPGREAKALEYGIDVGVYWGKLAADGTCTEPELFFSERGKGMWMVKGEEAELFELHNAPESQKLIAKGNLLLRDFCVDFFATGDEADAFLGWYDEVLTEIG